MVLGTRCNTLIKSPQFGDVLPLLNTIIRPLEPLQPQPWFLTPGNDNNFNDIYVCIVFEYVLNSDYKDEFDMSTGNLPSNENADRE